MKNKRYIWILIVSLIIISLAVGCSAEQNNDKSKKDNEKQEEPDGAKKDDKETKSMDTEKEDVTANSTNNNLFKDLPELPTTLEGFLSYPAGRYAGVKFEKQADEIKKILDKFPNQGDTVNKKMVNKYWKKLVYMFAEEYPNPKNIVAKWGAYEFGSPDIKDPRYKFKKNFNVEVILDASGSMAAMQGSKTRMELAKQAIQNFVSELPDKANVGLRVYGYKGSGSKADKKLSCSSNKLIYGIKPYKKKAFNQTLNAFSPAGWTPLANAIKLAKKDLSGLKDKNNTNIIYIVSDGIGTCGGDPVKQAKSLANANVNPIVNVIGFNVDNEGQKQLKDVAEAADGTYTNVQSQSQLQEEFDRSAEIASKWRMWQADAMGEARTEAVKRTKMIRDIRGEWVDRYRRERHNFDKVVDYLNYEVEKINTDFALALGDKQDKRMDKLMELKNQIWDDLWSIKSQDFDEAKKSIRQKYDANTEN